VRIGAGLLLSAVAMGSVALGATPATAHNYFGHSSFTDCDDIGEVTSMDYGTTCLADNANQYVYYELGPMLTRATDATLYGSYDTTRINVFKDGGHYTQTDAVYRNEDRMPYELLGRAVCVNDVAGTKRCDHFHVEYHSDRLNELGWNVDTSQNRTRLHALACHESGHTVGLLHGEDADPPIANNHEALRCMRTPLVETDTGVGAHNANHLNDGVWY
jgi:hypothetical protein